MRNPRRAIFFLLAAIPVGILAVMLFGASAVLTALSWGLAAVIAIWFTCLMLFTVLFFGLAVSLRGFFKMRDAGMLHKLLAA